MADPKKKDLIVRCTNIQLQTDGRQTVVMVKPPATPNTTLANGTTIVNTNEVELSFKADATDNFAVGKDYTLTIS